MLLSKEGRGRKSGQEIKAKGTGFGNERDLAKSRMYWDKNLYFKIITQVSHRKNDHKVALNLEVKSKVLKPEPFNEP